MNFDQFFEKFELLSETPDAVEKMRELILELAVKGRLVRQDCVDEPASILLDRIAARKSRRSPEGKGRTTKVVQSDFAVNEPDSLPHGWAVAPLSALVEVLNGRAYSKDELLDVGVPVLRVGNLFTSNHWYYSDLELTPEKYCDQGDLLFAWSASFGPFIWDGPKVIYHYHIWKLSLHSETDTNKKYLYWFLQNRTQEIKRSGHGVSMIHMTKEKMEKLPVWFPPLAEQKRIVAKVDELMALCDQLEAQQKERETQKAALVQASLTRFTDLPTPANLNFVFNPSCPIPHADLRKSIITVAVQGKLVPQDPNDAPAEQILRAVSAKRKATSEGFSNSGPTLFGPIEDREKPFHLPSSWEWARLGDIASIKHGFAFSSESFTDEITPFIVMTPGNFHESGGFRDRGSKTKHYRGAVDPEFVFKPRDLVIPMTEQAAGLLGSPAFIPDDGKTYLHNQRLGKLIFCSESIAPEFAFWFFNCEFFRDELAKTCTGMKVRHTSPSRVLRVPFPVAPLHEQRRIVAKLEELMGLVDRLEAQLAASRKAGTKLLEAVVAEIAAAA